MGEGEHFLALLQLWFSIRFMVCQQRTLRRGLQGGRKTESAYLGLSQRMDKLGQWGSLLRLDICQGGLVTGVNS